MSLFRSLGCHGYNEILLFLGAGKLTKGGKAMNGLLVVKSNFG